MENFKKLEELKKEREEMFKDLNETIDGFLDNHNKRMKELNEIMSKINGGNIEAAQSSDISTNKSDIESEIDDMIERTGRILDEILKGF